MNTFLFAFLLTLLAGMSTGIGGLIVLLCKTTDKKFLSFSMGFSAGVMVFISLAELYPSSAREIGVLLTFAMFFSGILIAWLIDIMVPHHNPNPHDFSDGCVDEDRVEKIENRKILRLGTYSMIAIMIHNFPEGAATFFTASYDVTLGFSMMVAIALHNIPEGLTVAIPIYYATGSRKKAFLYSLISGLSEPLGAVIAGLFLFSFAGPTLTGYVLAFASGFMIFVAFDELLPAAHQYDHHHISLSGVIIGMFLVGLSLFL